MKHVLIGAFGIALVFIHISTSYAQENVRTEFLEGEVVSVQEVAREEGQQVEVPIQDLGVRITKGPLLDQTITLRSDNYAGVHVPTYTIGDLLVIRYEVNESGVPTFQIQDFVRRTPMVWLLVLFLILSVLIGGKHGVRSLVSLGISFLIIVLFILPQIGAGRNPAFIAIVGGTGIALLSFYVSHGVNKKTTAAIVGTMFSFIVTALISQVFISWAHLSGFSADESLFLQIAKGDLVNIQGLVLASIIIGALGVLDDVTISQASIVQELKYADPSLTGSQLFIRAMRVGRDHIASLINTLVLVYTAGALPLLLLYIDSSISFSQFINYEIVAEEVIRTLAASIGLILAVPLTTLIAVRYVNAEKEIHRR